MNQITSMCAIGQCALLDDVVLQQRLKLVQLFFQIPPALASPPDWLYSNEGEGCILFMQG